MTYYYAYYTSSLGAILLLSDGNVLTGLYFDGQKHMPKIDSSWEQNPKLDIFMYVGTQLNEYLCGARKIFDIPYSFQKGTLFQQKVWHAIVSVFYGKTCSYSDVAKAIGAPNSTRAVAAAIGKNPISLVIPCHRIIGSNGALVGYAGGLERKSCLLKLEKE